MLFSRRMKMSAARGGKILIRVPVSIRRTMPIVSALAKAIGGAAISRRSRKFRIIFRAKPMSLRCGLIFVSGLRSNRLTGKPMSDIGFCGWRQKTAKRRWSRRYWCRLSGKYLSPNCLRLRGWKVLAGRSFIPRAGPKALTSKARKWRLSAPAHHQCKSPPALPMRWPS